MDGKGGCGADVRGSTGSSVTVTEGNRRRNDAPGTWNEICKKFRMRKHEERNLSPPFLLMSCLLSEYSGAAEKHETELEEHCFWPKVAARIFLSFSLLSFWPLFSLS